MKKATILGALALVVLVTALLAGPALSSPSSQQVTIKSLARQVNGLKRQVNALNGQVAAAQSAAAAAQSAANTAQSTAANLAACLHTTAPVSRYGDYVGTNAISIFTLGLQGLNAEVPAEIPGANHFDLYTGLDLTNTGDTVDYYVATVAPSCVGSFRMAEHVQAVPRR